MEIFKNPNYNFLAWKWPLIVLSLVLSVSGQISLMYKGGPRYGIDFKGGTLVYVKFKETPPEDKLRSALKEKGLGESTLQTYGPAANNEIIIGVEQKAAQADQAVDKARGQILETLRGTFGGDPSKVDLNNSGRDAVADRLSQSANLGQD